eukprot:354917-Chlamydomonas_euryale.AAC.1
MTTLKIPYYDWINISPVCQSVLPLVMDSSALALARECPARPIKTPLCFLYLVAGLAYRYCGDGLLFSKPTFFGFVG